MKRNIIIFFIIILLGRILFLSFCKNPEEISFKNKLYLRELSLNSDLPMQLMEKVDLTEQERKEFSIDNPYLVQITEDTTAYGRPYPYDNSENIYITNLFIYDEHYNVFGLSIGDDIEKAKKTMKKYGYMRNIFFIPDVAYKKGDVRIRFETSADNHIEEIIVSCYRYTLYDFLTDY